MEVPASASGDSEFAGFLSSVAEPPREPASTWNDDDLADDIATLSYEQALRTHARYRPSATEADPASTSSDESLPVSTHAPSSASVPGFAAAAADPRHRILRTASITIRLSKAEVAQLRRRAAEAGLTVSAYLRSCTLEVESLRAQVKQTLAQLRSTNFAVPEPAKAASPRPPAHPWWMRLWPPARHARPLQ